MRTINSRPRFRTSVSLVVLFSVLAIYSISLLTPLLWSLLTSFKDEMAFRVAIDVEPNIWKLIGFSDLTFKNFKTAYDRFKLIIDGTEVTMIPMFINSLLYAGGCALVATVVPTVVSYLVARYEYKLGGVVYTIVLITMAIPIVGSLPAEMRMVDMLGLTDSLFALFILKFNFLSIYFLVLHAQFKVIPKDYTEAAEIDGASDWYIMTKIIFPIAFGTISTVFIMMFIQFWNDYQTPQIYWRSGPVVAYGLFQVMNGGLGKSTPVKLSATMMVACPILIIFAIFNKKIMSNMSIGGVKG